MYTETCLYVYTRISYQVLVALFLKFNVGNGHEDNFTLLIFQDIYKCYYVVSS